MKSIKVALTNYQREELRYKLSVMWEGFDDDGNALEGYIAHDYGIRKRAELDALDDRIAAVGNKRSAEVEMDEREAVLAWGELENSYDIASDNASIDQSYAGRARSLKQAMDRIEEAAKAAGFDAKREGRDAVTARIYGDGE